jgi:hypothetical protein
MAITIVGRKLQKYRTTCTDENCGNILEFDQDDVGYNKTYSMGREVGRYEGIVCPGCNQVLKKENFEKIQ